MFNIAYNFMFKYYSFKFNIHLHTILLIVLYYK